MSRIKIWLKADGTMTVEAEGFLGQSCMTQTEKLIQDIRRQKVDEKLKQDYYANEANTAVGN